MKLSTMAIDSTLARDGVWRNLEEPDSVPEGTEVAAIKVARYNSPEYKSYIRDRSRNLQLKIREAGNDVTPEEEEEFEREREEIITDAIAEVLLKGWRGLTDDNGIEIPYSKENAYVLLRDPNLHEFKNTIVGVSAQDELYRAQYLWDSVGNSPAS